MSDSYLELDATFSIDSALSVELTGGTPVQPEPVLIDKEITDNGTYHAEDDSADGYANVTVNVPEPVIIKKSVTENGTYQASQDSADGYSEVVVDVPPVIPVLIDKSITENGTYSAVADEADGYANVTVDVEPNTITKTITENGVYDASSENVDGYSSVTVNVPQPQPVIIEKSVTENGVYLASSDNADGYSKFTVDVPQPEPVILDKTITENGVYDPTDYNADGFGKLTVIVSAPTPVVDVSPIRGFYERGIQATRWRSTDDTTDLARISGTYTAVEGEYIEINATNNLLMAINNVQGSYYMFGIKFWVDPNFTPRDSTNWYQCSCIIGQELGGTQRDFACIIDKNGYFALGWSTGSITSSTISALDGEIHTVFILADDTSIRLFIDGNEEVVETITMRDQQMWSVGIFYNRDNGNTRVDGKVYRCGYFSAVKVNGEYAVPNW